MADKSRRKKRPRKAPSTVRAASPSDQGALPAVAEAPLPSWLRAIVATAAVVYLFGLFFSGVQPTTTQKLFPPTARYFTQATCLFPRAATLSFDYRLEGWDCSSQSFRELDPRSYFPIHPRDKENRFYRAAHFHRKNRPVMEALEEYVMRQENTAEPARWGGIRVSSLRLPLPSPGDPVPRWQPPALNEHPPDLVKRWFYTPTSRRELHCAQLGHPSSRQSTSP